MIQVYQLNNQDCFAACVASLTKLNKVPKVNFNSPDTWAFEYKSQLYDMGYRINHSLNDPKYNKPYIRADLFILHYKDKEPIRTGHARIVNKNGLVLHDPAWLLDNKGRKDRNYCSSDIERVEPVDYKNYYTIVNRENK